MSYIHLQSVDFPKATAIGDSAFYSCSSLKNANFPLAQTIGYDAFSSCSDLESIIFPSSAQLGFSSSDSSYSNPFTSCRKITFTLSGSGSLSVITSGKALVRNSTILLAYPSASGNITLNNITALDRSAFAGCSNLDSIDLPNVTTIGSAAFSNCSNIQDATFPLATSIGSSAFSYCTRLQSTRFPLVTTVGESAFSHAYNLVTLDIPKVTTIGASAFSYTGNGELTITMGPTAPTVSRDVFNDITTDKTVKVKVKVPSGATGYSPFSSSSVTVSGTNSTENWANGFRGGGWNGYTWNTGSVYLDGTFYINQKISLVIQPK